MKNYLIRYGLMVQASMKFRVSVEKFKDILSQHIDNKYHVPLKNFSENNYRGLISGSTFKLERNPKVFDSDKSYGVINGNIETNEDEGITVFLETTCNTGFYLIFIVGIALLVGGLVLGLILMSLETILVAPGGIIAMVVAYISSRNDAEETMRNFKRDIFYYVNKGSQLQPENQ